MWTLVIIFIYFTLSNGEFLSGETQGNPFSLWFSNQTELTSGFCLGIARGRWRPSLNTELTRNVPSSDNTSACMSILLSFSAFPISHFLFETQSRNAPFENNKAEWKSIKTVANHDPLLIYLYEKCHTIPWNVRLNVQDRTFLLQRVLITLHLLSRLFFFSFVKNRDETSCDKWKQTSQTYNTTSSLWGWRSTGTGCPGRLWSLLLWRYSRPAWTRSCAAYCRWSCFGRGFGLDDPQRSLPTPTILWFCDSVRSIWHIPDQSIMLWEL